MDFFGVVNARRSVREFENEAVGRESLEQIVAAGIEAPSGCNMQLRQYVIVDDVAVLDQMRGVSKALATAPAVIVLLVEPKASPYGEFWVQDVSAAMQNMLLAAVALGYGGCWVEGAVRRSEELLQKLLGVPEHLRVWSLMPVGRPTASPSRPARPDLSSVLHFNRYGGK